MVKWTEDPEIRAIFDWFVGHIGRKSWEKRKRKVEKHISSVLFPKKIPTSLTSSSSRLVFEEDKFAWYLYLAECYLNHIQDYEFAQGARVIPIFQILGHNLKTLESIKGVHKRARQIVRMQENHPDGGIFELLVSLAYKKNGWENVILIPEKHSKPTPDIYIADKKTEWFIECKKMAKSSLYSTRERIKWLRLYQPLGSYLKNNTLSLILKIIFHVKLDSLDDEFLLDTVVPKLKFICQPCTLIDNEILTVNIDYVDYTKINNHVKKFDIKCPSSSLNELIFGTLEPGIGCTSMVLGQPSTYHPSYLNDITFAAGALWDCDAEEVIQAKARDIRRHLAEAIRQLPSNKPGIVHIGLESYDGFSVERERYTRIMKTALKFDAKGKDLHWIYCHIFDPRVPPDENWDFGETVYYFNKPDAKAEPLKRRSVALPDDVKEENGASWL